MAVRNNIALNISIESMSSIDIDVTTDPLPGRAIVGSGVTVFIDNIKNGLAVIMAITGPHVGFKLRTSWLQRGCSSINDSAHRSN